MSAPPRHVETALVLLHALTWGLPNTLVSLGGALLSLPFRPRLSRHRLAWVLRLRVPFHGGVCLGPLILVHHKADARLLDHEYGHFVQHLALGPLYHLVIGLPSLSHMLWWLHTRRGAYVHFYTEAWADAWGGVWDPAVHIHPRWTGYLWPGRPRPPKDRG
jgi:hypothetical protein